MCVQEKDLNNTDYIKSMSIKLIKRDLPLNAQIIKLMLEFLDRNDIYGEHLDADRTDIIERILYEAENAIEEMIF